MTSDQVGAAARSKPQRTAIRMNRNVSRVLRKSMTKHGGEPPLFLLIILFVLTGLGSAQSGLEDYRRLAAPQLDAGRVYLVRDREIELPGIHLTLQNGTIAFARPARGRITYAYFEGEGEALVVPHSLVERKSMGLFTGNAILEERFKTAYFAFCGGEAEQLEARLQPAIAVPD